MQMRTTTKSGKAGVVRVFIADDEPETLRVFTDTFKGFPTFAVVGTSQSAKETVNKLRVTPANLLILDINFGSGKTGLAVIEQLKAMQTGLKILVVTQKGEQFQNKSFIARANGFLLKPFYPGELAEAVVTVLSGKLFYNEALLQPPPVGEAAYRPEKGRLPRSITDDERLTNEDREYLDARLRGISDAQYTKDTNKKMETISQRRYRITQRLGLDTDIESWLFWEISSTSSKQGDTPAAGGTP